MKEKSVVLVSPLPPPYGGISHWTKMILRYSQGADRVPIRIIDIAPRHRSVFQLSVWHRLLGGVPSLLRQIIQVVTNISKADTLALHITTPGQYALVRDTIFLSLARLFNCRSIFHIRIGRVPDILKKRNFESVFLQIAMKLASHTIAIDQNTYTAITTHIKNRRVSLLPNCIDFSELPVVPQHKEKRVVFVGWVLSSKGVEDLLQAWKRIENQEWTLRIIGPYDPQYVRYLEDNFDLRRVEIVGEYPNPQVLQEIAQASIFCLPSHTEGFPNVVLEAMALKCAIIATPVGAIPEMLHDGSGCIVDVSDTDALFDQMTALINDTSRRELLGSAAFQRAKTHFSLERIYREYEIIWKGVQS